MSSDRITRNGFLKLAAACGVALGTAPFFRLLAAAGRISPAVPGPAVEGSPPGRLVPSRRATSRPARFRPIDTHARAAAPTAASDIARGAPAMHAEGPVHVVLGATGGLGSALVDRCHAR